jgi:hypothetical protein
VLGPDAAFVESVERTEANWHWFSAAFDQALRRAMLAEPSAVPFLRADEQWIALEALIRDELNVLALAGAVQPGTAARDDLLVYLLAVRQN